VITRHRGGGGYRKSGEERGQDVGYDEEKMGPGGKEVEESWPAEREKKKIETLKGERKLKGRAARQCACELCPDTSPADAGFAA
jgi:hypothetical protein